MQAGEARKSGQVGSRHMGERGRRCEITALRQGAGFFVGATVVFITGGFAKVGGPTRHRAKHTVLRRWHP